MKKFILSLTFVCYAATILVAQTNTFPSSGSAGIGTVSPTDQLDVLSGNRKVGINTAISGVSPGGIISLSRPDDGNKMMFIGGAAAPNDDFVIFGSGGGSELRLISGGGSSSGFGFYTNQTVANSFASTRPTPVMKITGSGLVGIGTINPDYLLTVNGKIKAEEIQVVVDVPADYVFETNYRLMPLVELEKFVGNEKHLPNVPSGADLIKNGYDVGKMTNKLLEKTEELTLYLIQLNKEIALLKQENEKLNEKVKSLVK